ncbi:hypothetical protein L207DRAFT_480806 [Hyaloscypha variabilis F]|uniref:Zn(2)-C6 fungal-type domain-containing protein n=1 Tax=Hyaloscypha variabilis (strain UAMH 11265 / GT02V1 / F) TaxID=1149755 RepID=A0A2J6S7Y3_HYAVF|nr:hypothetical protein L207DRAFT_480806 [Hyaloscypha variabilis F]
MRRPHRKTRTGCLPCKQRKIKCDEEKPSCRYCVRHSTECSYNFAARSPPRIPFSSSQAVTMSIRSPPNPPTPNSVTTTTTDKPSFPNVPWNSLELLYHFTISTSRTIARDQAEESVWQVSVPRLALDHPFLMQGIFAIAALHLAHLRPGERDKYSVLAADHLQTALQSYRVALLKIDRENCHAVLACSALIVALSLGSSLSTTSGSVNSEGSEEASEGIFPIPDWFHFIRGASKIVFSSWPLLQDGFMLHTLHQPAHPEASSIATEDDAQLTKLAPLFEDGARAPSHVQERNQACREALKELRTAFDLAREPRSGGYNRRSAFRWPGKISDDFIALLSGKEPGALILFAHQCVLLKREEPCWYMDGHAARLISMVKDNLSEEWWCFIQWPLDQIHKK